MINDQAVGETLAYKSVLLSARHGLRPLTVLEAMNRAADPPKFTSTMDIVDRNASKTIIKGGQTRTARR